MTGRDGDTMVTDQTVDAAADGIGGGRASMRVDRLALDGFRSWDHLVADFSPGVNVLVGRNGIGKTNIVEAMEFLSVGSSHRASASRWLVRRGGRRAVIRANVRIGDGSGEGTVVPARLQATIPARGAVRARLNDDPAGYLGDIAGLLKVVLFSPADEQLVSGEPRLRRELLNQTCVLMDPAYYPLLQRFRQSARQRSAVLRRLQEGFGQEEDRGSALAELEAWTSQFTALGIAVTQARAKAVDALAPLAAQIYRRLADGADDLRLVYQPSFAEVTGGASMTDDESSTSNGNDFLDDPNDNPDSSGTDPDRVPGTQRRDGGPDMSAVRTALARHFQRLYPGEVARGTSLIGPQRDDLGLLLDGQPAREGASNGEMWTIALALRMAQYRWLAARGPRPVLVLDDVFSQLDEHRRAQILAFARSCGQVFITVAARSDIPNLSENPSRSGTISGEDLSDHSSDVSETSDASETSGTSDVPESSDGGPTDRIIDVEALAGADSLLHPAKIDWTGRGSDDD